MIIKSLKIKDYLRYNNNFYKLIILITFLELFFLTNIQWAIPYDYYNQGYEKLKLKANYNIKNDNAIEDLNIAFAKKVHLLKKVEIITTKETHITETIKVSILIISIIGETIITLNYSKNTLIQTVKS